MSQEKSKLVWRAVFITACAICALCIIGIAAYMLPKWLSSNKVVTPAPMPTINGDELLSDNPIDFAALQAKNPDTVAWIKVPGTIIDYPVMRSGENREENFYLDHNSEGKPHRAGAIYMQKLNDADFSNPNTVLYGHDMANGSMFSWLHQFRKKDFFDKNRTITIYTPGHILTYEIYSAFVYDNRHILNSFNFYNKDDYAAFLEQTLNPTSMKKQVREEVSVTTNARIITLSTCTGISSQRYLVVGVLTNDQRTN